MSPQLPGRSLVQAWISNDVAAQLRDRAVIADRSVAAEIRCAIRHYLSNTSEAPAGNQGSAKTVGDDDRALAA